MQHQALCRFFGIGILTLTLALGTANAKDIRLKLPKRSKPTPVQQLNRDGVKAVENHNYAKAKKLFYKAYLLDPNDPFTLNNLGYISELEGDVERAQRYYDLASQQESDALIDAANDQSLKGKPVSVVAGNFADTGMQVNRLNVEAIGLLLKDRAPEADLLLQKAISLDAKNPFTLNNMGYTKEKQGELESALSYYNAAAQIRSSEPIVVAVNKGWRGEPISGVAEDNANKLRKLMKKEQGLSARVARLNLQGVSAMNRNDRRAAHRYFEQAYELDPDDAFTLNNMGYLAELQGDQETADFYYAKAVEAKRRDAKVSVATRRDMEGKRVGEVADIGEQKIEARMAQEREARARQGGPIQLKRRDNSPVAEPAAPATQLSAPTEQVDPDANRQATPVPNHSGTQDETSASPAEPAQATPSVQPSGQAQPDAEPQTIPDQTLPPPQQPASQQPAAQPPPTSR
ncbi:MAG TPA: tetratricopeptide repeat protein [Terriglobales bacterium]|nr:tetratricopeptide repeat protein [Terriglobales bacterium]